jgi:hypothetical protein
VYVAVGGLWAVVDRWGWRPLEFEAVIVLLTAIHFHYAGFLLPVVTGLAMRRGGGRLAGLAGVSVVAGVPLVALGITATQLHFSPLWECASAWWLAGAAMLTAWLHLRLTAQRGTPPVVRLLWLTAALSLAVGMVLAAAYGSRCLVRVAWLDIPFMRAVHGTALALGFGLGGMLGWTVVERGLPTAPTNEAP